MSHKVATPASIEPATFEPKPLYIRSANKGNIPERRARRVEYAAKAEDA